MSNKQHQIEQLNKLLPLVRAIMLKEKAIKAKASDKLIEMLSKRIDDIAAEVRKRWKKRMTYSL